MPKPELSRVRDVLHKPDAVIFAGAGLSRWSGLPSWTDLLADLADFRDQLGLSSELVRRELDRGDLLQAASFGFMDVTNPQRHEFILTTCHAGHATPSQAHDALLRLPPTCFVTTNYDDLIERSLSQWRSEQRYTVTTNRQQVDQPSILRATASHFVFKPHGHAEDAESVIFTREDYRRLANEWAYTLQTLRTLLLTRPVVFVGFGLRDPDFLMVQDAIADDYAGGAQDHYCLALDPHPDETRYWREAHGVHLVGYDAVSTEESNPHAALVDLLTELATDPSPSVEFAKASEQPSTDQVLALMRLAARNLKLTESVRFAEEIPLRLRTTQAAPSGARRLPYAASQLYSLALQQLEGTVYIFGPPGAGKTFGVLRHLREMATALSIALTETSTAWSDIEVPIYVSLRLYAGSLRDLIEHQLPVGLELEELIACPTLLVLDGINEIPQAHLDDGHFAADLDGFLSRRNAENGAVLILGRALGELSKSSDFPRYELDEIDYKWLSDRLPDIDSAEMLRIAARPIVYRMFRDGIVSVTSTDSPATIYHQYFDQLVNSIAQPLREGSLSALAVLAFEAVGDGSQAIDFSRVIDRLGARHPEPDALAARLLELGLFEPVAGSRVVLPHQSFLEYLAALEVVDREAASPGTVTDLGAQRSFDYVALFAASLSEGELRHSIVDQLLRVDLIVGIRAVLYSGHSDAALVNEVLRALRVLGTESEVGLRGLELVSQLTVVPENEEAIVALATETGLLAASAAALLLKLKGGQAVAHTTELLINHRDDYNTCTAIGRSLKPLIDRHRMEELVNTVERTAGKLGVDWSSQDESGPATNLSAAVCEALADVDRVDVLALLDAETVAGFRLLLLTRHLWTTRSARGFNAAKVLVRRGAQEAVFPLYGFLAHSDSEAGPDLAVGSEVVARLVEFAGDDTPNRWAAKALLLVGRKVPSERSQLEAYCRSTTGMLALILGVAASGSAPESHHAQIERVVSSQIGSSSPEWELVAALGIDWGQFPTLLESILFSDDLRAIQVVAEELQGTQLPHIDLVNLDRWLEQLVRVVTANPWTGYQLGLVLSRLIDPEDEQGVVVRIEGLKDSRIPVAQLLLPAMSTITTDDLSPEMIALLLEAELDGRAPLRLHSTALRLDWSALARLSTERFVEDTLLPLLSRETNDRQRQALSEILDSAGRRHGRRYIGVDGLAL